MKTVSACVLASAVLTLAHCQELNNRPIIGECGRVSRVLCPVSCVTCPGILSQRISRGLDAVLPPGHNFTTYVAASYVKWVEGAGARAAPIVVNNYDEVADLEYYDQVGLGRMASDYAVSVDR